MGGLSRWAVRKPWWALGAFLLFAAVIGYLGTAQKGTLNDSFSLPDTQSKTATDLLESMQGDSASAATALNATVIWSPESGTAVDDAGTDCTKVREATTSGPVVCSNLALTSMVAFGVAPPS